MILIHLTLVWHIVKSDSVKWSVKLACINRGTSKFEWQMKLAPTFGRATKNFFLLRFTCSWPNNSSECRSEAIRLTDLETVGKLHERKRLQFIIKWRWQNIRKERKFWSWRVCWCTWWFIDWIRKQTASPECWEPIEGDKKHMLTTATDQRHMAASSSRSGSQ